jgi:hypothetical protein
MSNSSTAERGCAIVNLRSICLPAAKNQLLSSRLSFFRGVT